MESLSSCFVCEFSASSTFQHTEYLADEDDETVKPDPDVGNEEALPGSTEVYGTHRSTTEDDHRVFERDQDYQAFRLGGTFASEGQRESKEGTQVSLGYLILLSPVSPDSSVQRYPRTLDDSFSQPSDRSLNPDSRIRYCLRRLRRHEPFPRSCDNLDDDLSAQLAPIPSHDAPQLALDYHRRIFSM